MAFDLDGTLIDSADGIAWAVREAAGDPSLMPEIGPPLADMLRAVLPGHDDEALAAVIERFRVLYDDQGWRRAPAYPGAEEMLDGLRAAGLEILVVTNKRHGPTGLILGTEPFAGRVDGHASLDTPPGFATKADALAWLLGERGISPAEAVYVGDSPGDRTAATAVGCGFVAVGFGYGGVHLDAAGDEIVVRELAELLPLLLPTAE